MIGPSLRRRLFQWLQAEPKPASLLDDPRFQFERIETRRLLSTMVGWDGTALSVQDALGTQDNDLVVSVASDGAGLIVHDTLQTVATSIVGATQIDSHTVRIDFILIDAQGVDRLKIETFGGVDRVRLELAGTSESLLNQFDSFAIDLGGESGDVAAIVGDVEIEAKVKLGSGLNPTNITLSSPADPTLISTLTVSATSAFQGVDLVGFPAVSVRSDAADDELQIAVGFDAATGSSLAWKVSGQGDAVDFTSLQLVDVRRVEVDTSDLDGKDSILVVGLDAQQGIEAIKLRTGLGDDSLVWSGNGSLQGSLTIDSGDVSIIGTIETEGGDVAIQAREVFELRSTIVTQGGRFDLVAGERIELDTLSIVDTSGITTGKIGGGQIYLAVDQGDLKIQGALVSRGASVDLGTAGRGGDVNVVAFEGELAIATIDVSGGDHSNATGHGGDAGSIVLIARRPSGLSGGEIRLSEMLRSEGGIGQNGSNGASGKVRFEAAGAIVAQAHSMVVSETLWIVSGQSVGAVSAFLSTRVEQLEVDAKGDVYVADQADGLRLVDLDGDGVSVSAIGGVITAKSPLTISADVNVADDFSLTAGNSSAPGDDLTIDSGAVVRLSSTSGPKTLTLAAGDDLVVVDGRVEAVGGLHRVNLFADREGDAGVGDGDGGTITQRVAGQLVLQGHEAVIEASRGIGSADWALKIDVAKLDADADGQVRLLDRAGGLQLVDLTGDGVAVAAAGGSIESRSPLRISDDVIVSESFSLTAGNSSAAGDDLTIDSGAVVRLSSTSGPKTLTLAAGDDLVVVDGRIEAVGGLHRVNLFADRESDAGVGDGDGGTITQQVAGQLVLQSHEAVIEASRGIGSSVLRWTMEVTRLTTDSSWGGGNQFLDDMNGDLGLQSLRAGAGMIDLRVQGNLVDDDPSSTVLNIDADSAVLEASGAIELLQTDLNRVAVTAGAGIELHDVDDLVIDQVGRLDGAFLNAGGTNVDLIIRAEGMLSVRAPVVHTGAGAIELVGTSLMIDAPRGDITNADGPIRLNARTGVLGTVDGVLIEARDSIWLQADDLALSSGSRIHVSQGDGELWIGTATSNRKIGLGDSAGGGLQLSSAETQAFDVDRIRVGVTANSFFASATAGEIELRDWSTASTFAADFLALRTTSQIRGGGNLDLSAGSSDLVMRAGGGIDLTEGVGNRNLAVVAALNGSVSRGIAIDDTIDGLTIGIVDRVNGIESWGGDLRVAAWGVTADLLLTATVVRHGGGVLELVADDAIVISASAQVRGIGSGDVRLGSDRDGLTGDGVTSYGASPDGILFQELAGQVGRVDGGAGSIELDGGRGTIILGQVVNTNAGSDAIVIRTEGQVQDGRSIVGADVQSQGEVRFEARESIGDGDAIEVAAPIVNAVVMGDGNLTLRNLSSADSSWTTEIQGQGELRITSLPGRMDLEARTGNGPIEIEAGSVGIVARAIEAGGDQDIGIKTILGGDVVAERITTGGRVTIVADGALDARAANAAVEIEAEELVAVARRAVGSTHQLDVIVDRLEVHGGTQGIDLQVHGSTHLVDLDPVMGFTGTAVSSSGGSISLLVTGDLTVRSPVLHTGVGSIELRIDGAGTLDVRAPIAAAAGDLLLIAGTTNDSDLILRDSLPNGVAEIRVGGTGRVVGSAGGDIRFEAPAGGHVLVATTTGTATSVAPLATLIAVDQGGSNVNALGNALVDVKLNGVANEINRNYGIVLNWNDLIFPVDTFPLPGNPVANPATRFDGGTYRFFHNFPLGNPDQLNPANDIPVDMTVRFDPRPDGLGGTIFGIDFFVDGQSVAVTTQRVELSVPGDGLFGAIVFPPAEIERIAELPVSQVVIREVSTPVVIQQSDGLESVSVLEEELKETGTRLFYRVLDAEGQPTGEEIELPLEFLDRGRLFEYFKQLPDGRYTLLLEEAGDPLPRTLLQLNVDQHRLVPLEQDGEGNPGLEPDAEQEIPDSSAEETTPGGEGSDLLPITLPNATTVMAASTETPTDFLMTELGESASVPQAARELAIDLMTDVVNPDEGASGEASRANGLDSRWLGLLPVSAILVHRRFTRMTGGLGWKVIERSEADSMREGLLSPQVAGRKDAEQ